MPHFKIINKLDDIKYNQKWKDVSEFKSLNRIVDADGKKINADYAGHCYEILSKKERQFSTRELIGRKFLGILAVICTFGQARHNKNVQNLLTKQKENIRFGMKIDFPVINFDQETELDYEEIVKLHIFPSGRSNLSCYQDSYFEVINTGYNKILITRRKLPENLIQEEKKIATYFDRIVKELEPEDCHFRVADIHAIGNKILGFRHVSNSEEANRETTQGMFQGCSLNISFQKAEQVWNPNKFFNLNNTINTLSHLERQTILEEYEKGISSFIKNCIRMDTSQHKTVQDILNGAEQTRFLVLNYSFAMPTDTNLWGNGLGRFPKQSLKPDNIVLLPSLNVNSWMIPDNIRNSPLKESTANKIEKLMIDHYRKLLLTHLRA